VHEELKRRGVTLMILWEEHRAAYVDGHGYSRYVAPGFMLRNRVRAASCAMIGIIDAT
jgi:transposase